uniref:Uncharacterized protein n=1 Tax=viral metagenome TaxID=1070528 RepID=A0A6C0BZB2_9ZZZZ
MDKEDNKSACITSFTYYGTKVVRMCQRMYALYSCSGACSL